MPEHTNTPETPKASVAVIRNADGKILTIYHAKWGAFTLPMTKRRMLYDPNLVTTARIEDASRAATRAFAECFGRTMAKLPELALEIPDFEQSLRDGSWKSYHYSVFVIDVETGEAVLSGVPHSWMTADEIADRNREPISPTARRVINELELAAKL